MKISIIAALLSLLLVSVTADEPVPHKVVPYVPCPCVCRGGPQRKIVRKNCRRYPLRHCAIYSCTVSSGKFIHRRGLECCDHIPPAPKVLPSPTPSPSPHPHVHFPKPKPPKLPCPCACSAPFHAKKDCSYLPHCHVYKCQERFPHGNPKSACC